MQPIDVVLDAMRYRFMMQADRMHSDSDLSQAVTAHIRSNDKLRERGLQDPTYDPWKDKTVWDTVIDKMIANELFGPLQPGLPAFDDAGTPDSTRYLDEAIAYDMAKWHEIVDETPVVQPDRPVLLSDRIAELLVLNNGKWYTCADLRCALLEFYHVTYSSGSVGQALQYLWAKSRVTKSSAEPERPARWRAWTGRAFGDPNEDN